MSPCLESDPSPDVSDSADPGLCSAPGSSSRTVLAIGSSFGPAIEVPEDRLKNADYHPVGITLSTQRTATGAKAVERAEVSA